MTSSQKPLFVMTEWLWQITITLLAAAVLFITFWCLMHGITTIFMHLYYFPIVLLAYHYRWRGCWIATVLALFYVGLVVLFEPGRPDEILGAVYRFLVFVGIAAIIAYLSEQLTRAERAGQESTLIKEQYISLAPAIILVLDHNGTITYLNDKGCRILECPADGIVGKDWVNTFIKEDNREPVRSLFAGIIRGDFDPHRMVEGNVITGTGATRYIRWYNTLLKGKDGSVTGVLSYGEDITEEKAAQDSLKTLQQFQESVIANANVWISVLAPDGTIRIWNDAAEQISGYNKADVVGKNTIWKQLYPAPEYRKKVTKEIRRALASDTHPEDFETVIRRADATTRTIVWNTRGLLDKQGTITSYIAIGRDVTAQKAAESRAVESARFLGAMIDTLPVPVFFKDASGKYLGCNPPFSEYLGITREEIVGKSVYDLSPRDLADTYAAADRQLFDNPVPQRYETQVQYADGSLHDVIFYKAPFFHNDGTLGGLIGTFLDITDRKTDEDRINALLREKEQQLRIINTSPAVAFLWKAEEHWPVEAVSDNITQFGYTPDDFLSNRVLFSSLVHPDDLDRVGSEVEYNSSNHIDDFIQEYRIFGKNHDLFWIIDYTHIRRDPSGTITHFEGIVLDITDRKRAEEALRDSEHRSAMLLRAIPDMMFIITREGVYRDVRVPDDAALALPADRIIGTNIRDSGFSEESTDTILYHLGMALDTNKLQLFEYELFLPQGLRQYEARMVALSNQEVLGIIRDITERKAMETALSLSQQTYRSYVDNSPVGIFVADRSGQYLDVNDAALRLLGYSHEEMMSMTVLDLALPKERQEFLDQFISTQEQLKTEPSVSFELRLKKKDGSACPVILSTTRLPNDTILGFTLDISERKAAEDALRESRQLFVDIISFLPDPTFVIDRDGVVVAWNRAIEQLSGVPAAEMIGKGDHEYSLWLYGIRRPILIDLVLHPDQDAGRMNYTGIHKEGRTITAETGIRRKNGDRPVTLSLVASPLIDSQGTVTGAIESMRDISRLKEAEADLARINQNLEQMVKDRTRALQEEVAQRMEAEKAVQASLDYTRSVIEANPDLMVVLDKNGIILDVNTAGELLTGIKKDQLIGTAYFGYLVEDGTVQSAFAGLLEKGRIENLVWIQRTDGHITPLSVHATVIRGREGSNNQIIVAAHDITRQKQDEDAIRASLEEKVVLLREIHHRVKNNLQIIISLTNLQMRQTDDPAIKQIISETQNRVRAMSLVHEKLYRSTSLSRIDFSDYTRFLATQLFSYFGTDTRRVKLDFAMGEIMVDINTAVPLGLLMNELVSNALKHAFPDGKEGTIGISGTTGEDQITLIVRDDGIGMPPDLDWKNTASLGMRLVTSLVDQVNGTITLDTASGTAWTVTVHKGPEGDREEGK